MAECSCDECVSACRNDPGRLVPDDLKKLADHLSIDIPTLEREYLVRIPMTHKGVTAYALAPAKRKGKRFVAEPGSVAPDYYADEKGQCVFLDDRGLCSVHKVKPFECGAYMGCKHTFLGRPYREKNVEEFFFMRWKGVQRPKS
ncbi:MAG TPA: YkgJ family cysteine cluster protein [Spirochaetota bacterium]|nr:YkgJ family cysteine cluster protein [Spirochaetota bacterium]